MNSNKTEDTLYLIGERFVYENFPVLFRKLLLKCEWNTLDKTKPYTEGADIEAWKQVLKKSCDRDWLNEADKEILGEGNLYSLKEVIKGPIEVKTSSFEQYIARNDYDLSYGVLPFAIWNNNNERGVREPPRTKLGSLYRMFYPKDAEHERQPLTYAAVFLNQKNIPYACLGFEDFPALKTRLIEVGSRCGLDLTEEGFQSIPCWNRLNGWKSPYEWSEKKERENPNLRLKGNMWYVAMEDVIDLATVTLIGEPPEITDGYNSCCEYLQRSRWKYLQQHSWKTVPLDTEKETKGIIQRRREIFDLMASLPLELKPDAADDGSDQAH